MRFINLDSGQNKAVLISVCVLLVALMLLFAKWAFGHAIAVNANEREIVDLGVDLTLSDPHAHSGLARLLEKTLLPDDQARAQSEFETAVSLSPHNYSFWLALGRIREQAGDTAGAESAFRKAKQLAPNYSRVQWALGNALLRQGRRDEAFAEIRNAVAADPTFANPAAAAAWQIFGGDTARIREMIGDSPHINGAVSLLLASDKRYAEALEFWRSIPRSDAQNELKETSKALYNKLIEGGMYRSAIEIASVAGLFPNSDVAVGKIVNGDFESSLMPPNANAFEWVIADGGFPRVGLNESQKRNGNYSLLMNFGQGGKGFRPVSQKVGVEPSAGYELVFYYRSELATGAKLLIEVFSAAGDPVARIPLMAKQDWGEARLPFTVPTDAEGIEIRLTIDGCGQAGCIVAGNIWFDDFTLAKR